MTQLRKAIHYTGSHQGINFLIIQHFIGESYCPQGTWCAYLLINERQIPEEHLQVFDLPVRFDDKGRERHDYMSCDLAELNWHGEITYYSKEHGADDGKKTFKFGCDYAHLWDEDRDYDEMDVLSDTKRLIEELWSRYPYLLVRSHYYGGYFPQSEGSFNKYDSFVADEEKRQWAIDYPSSK